MQKAKREYGTNREITRRERVKMLHNVRYSSGYVSSKLQLHASTQGHRTEDAQVLTNNNIIRTQTAVNGVIALII